MKLSEKDVLKVEKRKRGQINSRFEFLKPICHLFISISYLLFPLKCLKCQRIIFKENHDGRAVKTHKELFKDFFCASCISESETPCNEHFKPPFCEKCGEKFEHEYRANHLCENCLKSPGKIGKVRAGARYSGLVKESIQFFKYHKKLALGKPLGKILFTGFNEYFNLSEIDLIIPVPLHASKLRQRGFNQAFLVLKDNFSGFEIDINSLKRVKKTKPQINFSGEQRKENVRDAFKVMKKDKIKGKRILLVDDVYTTGATASEAAGELIDAKALSVDVLVIARA